MRDNDVIKALEYCLKNDTDFCRLCSYGKCSQGCCYVMANDLLELVKRQQAKIEELRRAGTRWCEDFDEYATRVRANAIMEFTGMLQNILEMETKSFNERYIGEIASGMIENDEDEKQSLQGSMPTSNRNGTMWASSPTETAERDGEGIAPQKNK